MNALIVDDSPTNVNLLRQLVALVGGCESTFFTDPVEALASLDGPAFDIVLVDYMMPHVDGIEFIRRLRLLPEYADTPVIMITTNDQRTVRHMALEAGATDFLTKPIDAVELRSRIRNLLALSEAQKKLKMRAARLSADVVSREEELILCLSRAAEYRDPDTGSHILRMAKYCRVIGEALGLNQQFCRNLYLASQMHDIGKIGVSDSILLKSGPLDAQQRRAMEQHTIYGHNILSGSKSDLIQIAAQIARSHHERWDGSGYPDRLAGEAIPLSSRIAAVADVLDALTSTRPYKRAWPLAEARAYLETHSGSQFDPTCVDALLRRWGEVKRIHDADRAQHPIANRSLNSRQG